MIDRKRFVGEYSPREQPVIVLLEQSSLEITVYVRQNAVHKYPVGGKARLMIEPGSTVLPCRVTRIGDQYVEAPQSIATFYDTGEHVLPIYVQPMNGGGGRFKPRLGATVKLLP